MKISSIQLTDSLVGKINNLTRKLTRAFNLKRNVWRVLRFLLLVGISFVILFPFISYFSSSLMSESDVLDKTVMFLPRNPTLDNFKFVIEKNDYFANLFNTSFIALMSGIIQTSICMMVGYGLARFKFRGKQWVFTIVILTMMIPPQTILISLYMHFRYFNIFGLLGESINMLDSPWPLFILSITGLGFKNGLFIFIMRQFFMGIPDELEDAAYVDGAGVRRTFLQIMIPISIPIIITVFLFVISWSWTDTFYSSIFFGNFKVLSNTIFYIDISELGFGRNTLMDSLITNTASLLLLAPLIIIYIFSQKKIMQGIERSGIVG